MSNTREILNNEQNDAPATADQVARPYDFRHAAKLSKRHQRLLTSAFQDFSRILSTTLSFALRGPVSLTLASLKQIKFGEHTSQLSTPSLFACLTLTPSQGGVLVEIDRPIAFAMLDRLLGGPGDMLSINQADQNNQLSDTELTLLNSLADYFCSALASAWQKLAPVQPQVADISLSAEALEFALPSDSCVLVGFDIQVMEGSSAMRLCIPYSLLEPMLEQSASQQPEASPVTPAPPVDPISRQMTMRQLEKVTLPVSVQLGAASVSINDLLNLQAGDVICLDSAADGTLELLVDGRLRGRVRPGLVGHRLAVRVDEVVAPETLEARLDLTTETNHSGS